MRNELQTRLVHFVGGCIRVKKSLDSSFESFHLAKQLIRSSTSAALNYGEAQGAESKKDFIHKQSVLLKELRETYINLLIIEDNKLSKSPVLIASIVKECNELICIFVTSIQTAKSNQ